MTHFYEHLLTLFRDALLNLQLDALKCLIYAAFVMLVDAGRRHGTTRELVRRSFSFGHKASDPKLAAKLVRERAAAAGRRELAISLLFLALALVLAWQRALPAPLAPPPPPPPPPPPLLQRLLERARPRPLLRWCRAHPNELVVITVSLIVADFFNLPALFIVSIDRLDLLLLPIRGAAHPLACLWRVLATTRLRTFGWLSQLY